ncbi:MAG: glycosyltransferase family 87 protein [Candidatus Paceibacterales bacterium]
MFSNLKQIKLGSELIVVFSLFVALLIFVLAIYIKDIQPTGSIPYTYWTDFVSFYTAGKIIDQNGSSRLYDLNLQYNYQHSLNPVRVYSLYTTSPFFNPPFVALPFTPLAKLPFDLAYKVDLAINLSLLILICCFVYKLLNQTGFINRLVIISGIITFLPIDNALLIGQFSILLSLVLLLTWKLLSQDKPYQAGLLLSLLLIKPYLIIFPVIFFLLQKRFRVLKGMIAGGGVLFLISFFLMGWNGLVSYTQMLMAASNWNYEFEIFTNLQYNLQNLLMTLLSAGHPRDVFLQWFTVCLLVFISTSLFLFRKRSNLKSNLFTLKWAALIPIMLLLSPHTHFHDLGLLIVPAVLLIYLNQEKGLGINNWLINSVIIIGYLLGDLLRTEAVPPTWQIELEIIFMLLVLLLLSFLFDFRHKLWYTTQLRGRIDSTE